MIVAMPPEQTEIIYKYIMTASLWFLSVVITAWVGFRYGLRSQKEAAKLKARNDVFAIIDRIRADMEGTPDCWNPHSKIRGNWENHDSVLQPIRRESPNTNKKGIG